MKYFLALIISFATIYSGWTGYQLYETTQKENVYKYDYAEIKLVKYGLFNLDIWKEKIFSILESKAGGFELKSSDYNGIQRQIEKYLVQVHEDYFESGKIIEYITEESKADKKGVSKLLMGLFKGKIEKQIEKIDFKSQIPGLAKQLTNELKKKTPEIKQAITEQISKMIAEETSKGMQDQRQVYIEKYEVNDLEELSAYLSDQILQLQFQKKKWITHTLIGLLLSIVLLLAGIKLLGLRLSMTLLSIVCSIFLIIGLALPMIILDARLTEVDLKIMDETVHFDEQFMYYQSKSIIDVTQTLLRGKGTDLKIVGFLILLFSIILPATKMLATNLYLYAANARRSRILKIIIFHLGKWSMADVFVVAIFMSYIGFYGLVSSQLGDMERHTDSFTLDTINYSSLAPGIIFFTLYCIFSIMMSSIVHRQEKKSYAINTQMSSPDIDQLEGEK